MTMTDTATNPDCTATRHGDNRAYCAYKCRCPDALTAARRSNKRHQLRRLANGGRPLLIDGTGTARRLQALVAIGWSSGALAAELGVSGQRARQLMRQASVDVATAEKVTALYGRLAESPRPDLYPRNTAARNAWAPPHLWDDDEIDDPTAAPCEPWDPRRDKTEIDEVIVARLMGGWRVDHTRAERLTAVDRMRAAGMGLNAIAARMGKNVGQVCRDLRDLGRTTTADTDLEEDVAS